MVVARLCGVSADIVLTPNYRSVPDGCPAGSFDDALPGLLRAGQDGGVPLNVRDPFIALRPGDHAVDPVAPGEAGRGPAPFR